MIPSRIEETARVLADMLRESAAKGDDFVLPGLGTFETEHHSSAMERLPDGRLVLEPPRDTLRFAAEDPVA